LGGDSRLKNSVIAAAAPSVMVMLGAVRLSVVASDIHI
jgi:hypothetical protein